MSKCIHHPSRDGALSVNHQSYCSVCKDQIANATKNVDTHVQPKDCFIWYADSKSGWKPIEGTGCAHWVAHQLGIKRGLTCLEGYTYRVHDLIKGMKKIDLEEVRQDDVYVTPSKKHTGLVVKVKVDPQSETPKITIRHDSSGQHGIANNDFATYFKGKGIFYRYR